MNLELVSSLLDDIGLGSPRLRLLEANDATYHVLLLQPHGEVEVTARSVRNRDRDLARAQFAGLLATATRAHAELVVTPQYAMPWATLVDAVKAGVTPSPGELWALGCESILPDELATVRLEIAEHAILVHESVDARPGQFLDPLAYVFSAPPKSGAGDPTLVVLVQFKTQPMGDEDHFETSGMCRGSRVYKFGGLDSGLSLVSLICSDALAFTDADAQVVYDRTLVLHVQLNAKPRQLQFRSYRDKLFGIEGDATELICLNWPRGVRIWSGDTSVTWDAFSASAWYLKPKTFDSRDPTLRSNHRLGLYYTWLKPLYAHAMFFDSSPGLFQLEATKVAHIGVAASLSRRRGPQLKKRFSWHGTPAVWTEQSSAQDGFSRIVHESGAASAELTRVAAADPFATERILALGAGRFTSEVDWHGIRTLDSFSIGTSEVILRLTFCQDTDSSAISFRLARLKRFGTLWEIASDPLALPPGLTDLATGFRLLWTSDAPHQNVVSTDGKRATLIYMGEDSTLSQVDGAQQTIAENLRRSFTNENDALAARQRLVVWFREHGSVRRHDRGQYIRIDQPRDASEFDIGREQ